MKNERRQRGKAVKTDRNEICPACSQTCDRGLGGKNELGRGVSEEERRD